jgi:hypothetical protein
MIVIKDLDVAINVKLEWEMIRVQYVSTGDLSDVVYRILKYLFVVSVKKFLEGSNLREELLMCSVFDLQHLWMLEDHFLHSDLS